MDIRESRTSGVTYAQVLQDLVQPEDEVFVGHSTCAGPLVQSNGRLACNDRGPVDGEIAVERRTAQAIPGRGGESAGGAMVWKDEPM